MASQKLPVWDLSALYRSPSDRKLQADLNTALSRARRFARRYRGKLRAIVTAPRALRGVLIEFEEILQQASKPVEYSYLRFAESAIDPVRGALLQNSRERCIAVSRELTFFELELLALPTGVLRRAANSAECARFRNFIRKLIQSKPHRLSEREEQILSEKQMTGSSAFTRLFDEEFAAKSYVLAGKKHTESEILDRLYHPRREVRRDASASFTNGLRQESRRLTFIFNTILQDKAIDDRFCNYEDPEASRHLVNQISRAAVNSMVETVLRSTQMVGRFYRLKRRLLGLPELFDYDRYAPLATRSKRTFSFSEARTIITESALRFSPVYAEIVDEFFRRRWIHAAPTAGKRSGAFCAFATADTHPFVFVNYSGTLKEVLTLAHELGHAVHAYLMRSSGYLNFGVPLTIAETASVFGEMLVFEYLRATIEDREELLALYCSKIEGVFATVFRQVSMHRFEQSAHAARRKEGELSTTRLSQLWRKHQTEMFRGSVTLSPGYDLWWSYIPHFLHTPFYVYSYAFGELLTLSLYAQYQSAFRSGKAQSFVTKYLEMLSRGDSYSPAELVKPFGISLERASFWQGGLDSIAGLVQAAEALSRPTSARK
ncbi:MAG: oligoendopeptidase F [Proteobacteria bacterium]|nr:oligoendopeptidase F [Pseudomonadota bacterium]